MQRGDRKRLKVIHGMMNEWLDFFDMGKTWHTHVTLMDDLGGDGGDSAATADVMVVHPYKQASIRLNRDVVDEMMETPLELETCIVHEIIHIVLSDMGKVLRKDLNTDGEMWRNYKDAEEGTAGVLAERFIGQKYGRKGGVII